MCLRSKRKILGTCQVKIKICAHQGICLNKKVFNWLQKWESVPFNGGMPFLGQTDESDSQFPWVRLLVLIKDDKFVEFN